MTEPRSNIVQFRCTDTELRAIDKYCAKHKFNRSDMLRQVVMTVVGDRARS
jgi:hypothetical protein